MNRSKKEYPAFYITGLLSSSRTLAGSEAHEAYHYFAEVIRKEGGFIDSKRFVSLVRSYWPRIMEHVPVSLLSLSDVPVSKDYVLGTPQDFDVLPLESHTRISNSFGIDSFIAPIIPWLWGNNSRINLNKESEGLEL